MDAHEASAAVARVAALGYDYDAQPKERPATCNLCAAGGRSVITLARRDRYGYPTTFVMCARCGLGYLTPRLTASGYAHFYEHIYRPLVSAYHGRRIDAETVQVQQRDYARGLLAFVAPRLASRPHTILDVGGSTGVVGSVLAHHFGAHASVLDPAPAELAVARAAGIDTIAGMAEDFDPGERRWDLVLLCQTIDHLLDVRGTLSALRTMTAAGGHVYIDILDLELTLRRTGSVEQSVKVDHPYYLTRASAEASFALAGFTVLAQHLTEDGHRGFLLAPGSSRQPDWGALRESLLTSVVAARQSG